jgi:hypothetical protein
MSGGGYLFARPWRVKSLATCGSRFGCAT